MNERQMILAIAKRLGIHTYTDQGSDGEELLFLVIDKDEISWSFVDGRVVELDLLKHLPKKALVEDYKRITGNIQGRSDGASKSG